MLTLHPGRKLNTYVPDYVVFDLETTGVSPSSDSVIEISAVKVTGGTVSDEFTTLVDPERPIPFAASAVNGIYDDMVKGSPLFNEALGAFLNFAGDAVLVGHNIHNFDMKFLWRDAKQYWGKTVGNDYVDTLPMARMLLPELPHHRLVDLAEHYGISPEGAHRALNDCRMNQQVYEYLSQEIKKSSPADLSVCPKCGKPLLKRKGRYGEFWGCTGYPLCRFTRNL